MFECCSVIQTEEKEMREVFAEVMEQLALADPRVIYLDCDIINSIKMTNFAQTHPEHTINCGIQESNMIGVAAGLSETGLIPFAHTFAPFATIRFSFPAPMPSSTSGLSDRIRALLPEATAVRTCRWKILR